MNDTGSDSSLLRATAVEVVDGVPLDCALAPGEILIIRTAREDLHAQFVHRFLGLEPLPSGEVRLFGQALPARDSNELGAVRSRVGVVFARGGLVSNLKVLENLLLPLQYHRLSAATSPETLAMSLLERVGYRGAAMALPGLLSSFERKQVVLARAMLLDPDLMIYDSFAFGLSARERSLLLGVAREFHQEKSGRGSLFLTADPNLVKELPGAALINLAKGVTE